MITLFKILNKEITMALKKKTRLAYKNVISLLL